MTDRRTEILDTALQVLAEHGMRGLTHRAVDAAAGLPVGSTSYYFRTRAALVTGCVARLVELDLATELPAVLAADAGDLVDVITGVGVAMTTVGRQRTLARYELSLAATRDPDLRAELVAGGDVVRRAGVGVLAALGDPDPGRTAGEVAAVLDGLVFTALVRGPADPDALAAWMRPVLARALGVAALNGRGSVS